MELSPFVLHNHGTQGYVAKHFVPCIRGALAAIGKVIILALRTGHCGRVHVGLFGLVLYFKTKLDQLEGEHFKTQYFFF